MRLPTYLPRPRAGDPVSVRSALRIPSLLMLPLVLASAACERAKAAPAGSLEDVVELGPSLELEENTDVINVTPTVAHDPRGGFLIADEREGQLRRYGSDGRLLWKAGRRGSGPGEFRSLSRVLRLPSGEVLAAERSGSFTLYDSAGAAVVRTVRNPFFLVEDLDVLDDSTLLVAARLEGRRGASESLHLWDLRNQQVRYSFFNPFPRAPNQVAAIMAGWTKAAIRGDTIAAVFALSDTMYFFGRDGRELGSKLIPFQRFRSVPEETPSGGSDPVKRAEWLSTFDFVTDVHWLPDGRLLVPYHSLLPEKALSRRWHLLGIDSRGSREFELQDTPRLLAVEPGSGKLFFVSPGSDVPNRWTSAELRR